MINIENYIIGQHKKYFQTTAYTEANHDFTELYENVSQKQLREIFVVMHAKLNDLFDQMNSRLPTGNDGAHFWAEQSRELIWELDILYGLQKQLANTEFAFAIDDYCNEVFCGCARWLSQSGGSHIPPHMEKVLLYYIQPMFFPVDAVFDRELHELGEQGELLGRGGFGEVYKYHHPIIDVDFAVKIFSPAFVSEDDKDKVEKRFFREAKLLFQLNHPNIVRIYDVGRIRGKPFIKIEYVDGLSLDKLQQKYSVLPFENAGKAMIQILEGLQHAHEKGIIHRDLKPSNIMVTTNGWICKIIDFGISAFMDTEGYTRLTRTGEQVAGGAYIDPQLMQRPELRDPRSDIYSAGAILFFLLCGRPPGPDAEQYLRKCNGELTDQQIAVVMEALSYDLDDRYFDCNEMILAIEEVLTGV